MSKIAFFQYEDDGEDHTVIQLGLSLSLLHGIIRKDFSGILCLLDMKCLSMSWLKRLTIVNVIIIF